MADCIGIAGVGEAASAVPFFFVMDKLSFLYWPEDSEESKEMDPIFDPERRNKHRRETMTNELKPATLAQVLQFVADCTNSDLTAIEDAISDRYDSENDDDDDDDEDDDDGQPSDQQENQDFAKDEQFEREQVEDVIDKID